MIASRVAFVGRDRERAELSRALEDTQRGRGGIWLITGIAGIGKSRLAEEVTRDADQRGFTVAWGRCWEAGGAPAFWPWLQALRSLCRERGEDPATAFGHRLAPLLDRMGQASDNDSVRLGEADAQRFQLLDAVTTTLCEIASQGPVLIVLDDLHAADHSTLMLLHFAARQLLSAGVMVVGTLRDREAHDRSHASLITRLSQDARTLALGPLDQAAIEAYVGGTTADRDPTSLAAVLHERTDGHPLFLVELVRLISSAPAETAGVLGRLNWPPGLEHALRDRVATIPAEHRDILDKAAVMGRELSAVELARYFECAGDEVRGALDDAVRRGLVMKLSPECYRFSHVLVRDLLERDLGQERRFSLHRRLAEAMSEQGGQAWSSIAHHFAAAGPSCRELAAWAFLDASESAVASFAFEDAAELCERGLRLAGSDGDQRLRGELLINLGRAYLLAGRLDDGRARCLEAIQIARELGDPELFALAALERGSALVFARVDPELVALLEEALAGLPPGDGPLRALVQARLAAAMQPSTTPEEPIALAREAIEMARRLGDDATLLTTLRTGCSAMIDLAPPEVCLPLNQEHARLARAAGESRDVLSAETRLIFNLFELGDRRGADAHVRAAAEVIKEIAHPTVGWRVLAMEAMRALWDGALEAALDTCERAASMGLASGDANARTTTIYQRQRILRMLGRRAEISAGIPEVRTIFNEAPVMEPYSRALVASQLLQIGRLDEAFALLDQPTVMEVLRLGDRTSLECLAEAAVARQDPELARGIREQLSPRADEFICGGVIGMTWEAPVHRVLGLCALVLGEKEAAAEHMRKGIEQTRRLGGEPVATWMQAELGEILALMGQRAEARSTLEAALKAATSLSMASVRERAAAAIAGLADAPASADPPGRGARADPMVPLFEPEGDVWRVSYGGASFRIKNSKGAQFLAALIAQPRVEVHVLELAAPGEKPKLDGSDAEVLDETARAAYKERALALRAELAQAEEWNDTARAEAARTELDFLTTELARGYGLGGRSRRFSSNAERARINVQRRIREAVKRIRTHDEALARHLERSVRTGMRCCYDPE